MKLEYIKGCLKGKVKVTQALLVAFFITGSISYSVDVLNINNYGEETGLELGDQSRARGKGSIATGKQSIAIGNHAVATGNNETKESIEEKLAADKKSLEEIAQAKRLMEQKTKELKEKQLRERETIEAGIRVEQIQKAKEKAKLEWQEDVKKWNTETEKSKDFLKEYQSKLDDLNSRLSGVSKIPNIDISSEEGLKKAALELKAMAEKGTTLNLSQEFYQDYISSYYKALGDLRLAERRDKQSGINNFYIDGDANYSVDDRQVINPYSDLGELYSLEQGIELNYKHTLSYNTKNILFKNSFSLAKGVSSKPTKDLRIKNIKTDLSTEQEWKDAKEQSSLYKKAFQEYFQANNNPNLTQEIKDVMYQQWNLKMDHIVKKYEITYYQKMYEDTKNSTFLDKKVKALKELEELEKQWKSIVYPNIANGYDKSSVSRAIQYEIDKFRKENITDVKEKNKITVDKLTSELEQALGINKQAIQEKEKELKSLQEKAEQAKRNYEGLNPSEEDKILAREYERVKQEVDALSQEVIQADERLKALKEALSLHDLKNIGENQIAIGTNSLAVGNNSIAFGTKAASVGENAISIGTGSTTTGEASISLGVKNVTVGNKSVNIGYGNLVKGNNNFILGSHIDASKIENAVVLGNNSTGETGTVSVGAKGTERKIIHVADGIVNKDSKDTVNGSQLYSLANNPANFSGFDTNNWKKALGVGNVDTSNLAKKDGSNIEVDHYITKLSNGASLENPTNKLVTDTIVKAGLDRKLDKTTYEADKQTLHTDLSKKANTDASNINVGKYTEKLSEKANLTTPTNSLVTDTKVKEYLNANYYTNTEIDKKISNVTVETKGDITSSTLEIKNGTDRLIGTENVSIELKNKAISKEKLSDTLASEIDNKANKNGDNITEKKDKEEFRNNLEVYSKTEVETKLKNIQTASLEGEITSKEERGVKGKVIDKHLKDHYVNKADLKVRDELIMNNYQDIQANKQAISNNARRIDQVNQKINKTAALAQATSNLDFGQVRVGNIALGAGVGNYMSETGVAVGVAYRPNESIFLSAKWTALAGEPRYNSYGASVSYQFSVK